MKNKNQVDFEPIFDGIDPSAHAEEQASKASISAAWEENEKKKLESFLKAFETQELSNGKYVLSKLKSLYETTVVVPDCVEVIADGAFEGSDVIEVTLPSGLKKIGA
ncbi:MAG: hypothetical protein IJD75_07610, partial [Clostridia bacterium]|nr:hypothetical protein [Clostridia bacterium]